MEIKLTDKNLKNFWKKVNKKGDDECWLWTGNKLRGYGKFGINYKSYMAHRVSFLIANGKFPNNCACHRCDIPACVNPSHLFDGTYSENSIDRNKKGRQFNAKGEKHGLAILTDEQALEICDSYKRPSHNISNAKELAEKYGVSRGTILDIVSKRRWRHVP